MFFFRRGANLEANAGAVLAAISRTQAISEFAIDGTILNANDNFLSVMGYRREEVVGQLHRMFVDPAEATGPEYLAFWQRLKGGDAVSAEFRRLGKGGREIWLEASYAPVLDANREPCRIVMVASDVTAARLEAAEALGQLAAISKSQAVIEFGLDGTVLTANPNFCRVMGYVPAEIQGRHHRMFVDPTYAESADYREFWNKLRRGEYIAAEFRRIGKGGREVWIQATYNPILDLNGKPFKIVKYATDVTGRKMAVSAIGEALAGLAKGDLGRTIDRPLEGELDAIREALNTTVGHFAEIVGRLRLASRSIKTAAGEILSGANDLAERSSRQASAVEETSAAVDQMTQAVTENARRAASAVSQARSVAASAEEGGKVMNLANEAMERISTSSSKISSIIGMIDDIAFQTNLLALNASVEAARAGDAGKGFAVVAIEVRRLAQSAAGASAEVRALIEQSSLEVTEGGKLVTDASGRLSGVLSGIRENADLVGGMARVTQEQADTIAEIASAIRQIDEMTQHNAALVEETNAALEQTEAQATELDRIVEVFVVDDVHQEPAALQSLRDEPPTRHAVGSHVVTRNKFRANGNTALKRARP